jgi:hypothetical protein
MRVDLKETDAKLFIKFREYQDDFEILLKAGVFSRKTGKIEIDIGKEGDIMCIKHNEVKYKR